MRVVGSVPNNMFPSNIFQNMLWSENFIKSDRLSTALTSISHSSESTSKALNMTRQGLSRLCVQRVIWTPRTLFSDSLDTQKFMSEFEDNDFS